MNILIKLIGICIFISYVINEKITNMYNSV